MYESYFGFSGPPFNLSPDPAFYFESRGHGSALSYLRYGVYQSEGFIVVTGEIGAGKTTLVRALLSQIDPAKIAAAQIVSTQLEAGDLLKAVANAFGITTKNLTKADLIATIEAFLTSLVLEGRRALLVVDEAQNLNLQAVEELRMLSNFQLGSHALLQSFLVGQPELRALLMSKPMEQFRQRVIASCHLGPMDANETRAYVEHRLRHVGWSGNPAFSPDTFPQIFAWSEGIPRRVNLLCNRVLLATFLAGGQSIDGAAVARVASEMRIEVGESVDGADRPVDALVTERFADHLFCVSTSTLTDLQWVTVLRAAQRHAALPGVVLVRVGSEEAVRETRALLDELGVSVPVLEIRLGTASSAATVVADAAGGAARLFGAQRPGAVAVIDPGDAGLACALVSRKAGVPTVAIDMDWRAAGLSAMPENRPLMERLCDLTYVAEKAAGAAMAGDVGRPEPVVVGSVPEESLRWIAAACGPRDGLLAGLGVPRAFIDAPQGFGTVMLSDEQAAAPVVAIEELKAVLKDLAMQWPLVWYASAAWMPVAREVAAEGQGRVILLPDAGVVRGVSLLHASRFVATDSSVVRAQAAALRLPVFALDVFDRSGPRRPAAGPVPDRSARTEAVRRTVKEILGHVAQREPQSSDAEGVVGSKIVEHLGVWLQAHGAGSVLPLVRARS